MKQVAAGRGGGPDPKEGRTFMTRVEAARGGGDMDSPPAWRVTAADFTAAVESGRLDLPLPGGGRTRERWARLADLAAEDLSRTRLGDGLPAALAILPERGGPP